MCAINYSIDYLYRHLYRLKRSSSIQFYKSILYNKCTATPKMTQTPAFECYTEAKLPFDLWFQRLDVNFIAFFKLKTVVRFSSVTQSCPTLYNLMDCNTPGFPVHHQLLELTQTHVHWVSDAIQPSHPLLSPCPPVFNLSQYLGLSNESVLHIRWPKYWCFSFGISPSNEYSGLISFKIDWFDLLAVQGALKNLQHHSSKVTTLSCSVFFVVQLSRPYMTTGKR